MQEQILTVTEFHALITQTLQYAYPEVIIEGEVSSYKVNQGKWVFFDIKDTETTISCFMPIYQLKTVVEDGMLVRIRAYPNITKWGKFSLTVRAVELAGEGSVQKAFEKLRLQFEQEGLFALDRKRPLPDYPTRIALITSAEAAAFADFNKILNDRWVGVTIDHAQVQVQGVDAPGQIVKAIEYFNLHSDWYDCLVIIRGGGSAEDLQAFNTEEIVRAVYASKIPTLVGIGHETDTCLSELVADVRAATPTDAARILVPDKDAVISSLSDTLMQSGNRLLEQVLRLQSELNEFQQVYKRFIASSQQKVNELYVQISSNLKLYLQQQRLHVQHQLELIQTLDPAKVLKRGYAIVTLDGQLIRDAHNVQDNALLMIQLAKGRLTAKKIGMTKNNLAKTHKNDSFNFAEKMHRLEEITQTLETDTDVEKALAQFKEASQLAQELQDYLTKAENTITTIQTRFEKKK